MNDSKPPKVKLRWYQFSLRTLLLVTLIIAIGFGLLRQRLQRIRNEIRTTAELEKLEANIDFYPQKDWKEVLSIPDRWLYKWYGDSPVRSVILHTISTADTDLEHLKGLTSLHTLSLGSTQVTDAGLEHLKGLTSLQSISLNGTQITDAGLEYLEGMTSLQFLYLIGTQVTDAGLEHLEGVTSLKSLYLIGTHVTDEGVKTLQQALPNCQIHH